MIKQQQYEYAYLFGAVCPSLKKAVGLIMPNVNTDAMILHLEAISAQATVSRRHAVVVLDRAGWHTTKKLLGRFKNISLLPLPPASPELNPTEQVWQVLRDEHLANRCFDGYEDIVDSCHHAWMSFANNPQKIHSLCSRKWAIL